MFSVDTLTVSYLIRNSVKYKISIKHLAFQFNIKSKNSIILFYTKTKFCTILGIIQASRILRLYLDSWKICELVSSIILSHLLCIAPI